MLQFEVVLRCMVCGSHVHSQISAYHHLITDHQGVLARIAKQNAIDPMADAVFAGKTIDAWLP
jgi:DNA-directed RNA polymerase subunit N (RpoN/RPB10)